MESEVRVNNVMKRGRVWLVSNLVFEFQFWKKWRRSNGWWKRSRDALLYITTRCLGIGAETKREWSRGWEIELEREKETTRVNWPRDDGGPTLTRSIEIHTASLDGVEMVDDDGFSRVTCAKVKEDGTMLVTCVGWHEFKRFIDDDGVETVTLPTVAWWWGVWVREECDLV